MRLGNIKFLPLDHTKLSTLLERWAAFPHIQGGHCKGCFGPDGPSPDLEIPSMKAAVTGTSRFATMPSASGSGAGAGTGTGAVKNQSIMSSRQSPRPSGTAVQGDGSSYLVDMEASGSGGGGGGQDGCNVKYKSELFPTLPLTAAWAASRDVDKSKGQASTTHPSLTSAIDKFSRTHTIIGRAEAVYCQDPFFTWRLINGGALHVGLHPPLYEVRSNLPGA